eukprot:s752_g1.t1
MAAGLDAFIVEAPVIRHVLRSQPHAASKGAPKVFEEFFSSRDSALRGTPKRRPNEVSATPVAPPMRSSPSAPSLHFAAAPAKLSGYNSVPHPQVASFEQPLLRPRGPPGASPPVQPPPPGIFAAPPLRSPCRQRSAPVLLGSPPAPAVVLSSRLPEGPWMHAPMAATDTAAAKDAVRRPVATPVPQVLSFEPSLLSRGPPAATPPTQPPAGVFLAPPSRSPCRQRSAPVLLGSPPAPTTVLSARASGGQWIPAPVPSAEPVLARETQPHNINVQSFRV